MYQNLNFFVCPQSGMPPPEVSGVVTAGVNHLLTVNDDAMQVSTDDSQCYLYLRTKLC